MTFQNHYLQRMCSPNSPYLSPHYIGVGGSTRLARVAKTSKGPFPQSFWISRNKCNGQIWKKQPAYSITG